MPARLIGSAPPLLCNALPSLDLFVLGNFGEFMFALFFLPPLRWTMDAYAILGVAPTASLVEIRAAYLQLARVVRRLLLTLSIILISNQVVPHRQKTNVSARSITHTKRYVMSTRAPSTIKAELTSSESMLHVPYGFLRKSTWMPLNWSIRHPCIFDTHAAVGKRTFSHRRS